MKSEVRIKMIRNLLIKVSLIVVATSIAVMATGCANSKENVGETTTLEQTTTDYATQTIVDEENTEQTTTENTTTDEQTIEQTTTENSTNISEKNDASNKDSDKDASKATDNLAGPVEVGKDKKVSLNTKTIIEVSNKKNRYKFVAPKDGEYVFMTLGGDVETYGGVWVNGMGNVGGSVGNNMCISQTLKKGETAAVGVRTKGKKAKKTTLVVCDKEGAKYFCGSVELAEHYYYAEVGDSLTITPIFCDVMGNSINIEDKGYNIIWNDCKYTENGPKNKKVGEGISHTFTSLKKSEFIDEGELREYCIEVYKDGAFVTQTYFSLYNAEGEIELFGKTMKVRKGDKVSLEVKAKERFGDKKNVDLSSDEFTVKWTVMDIDSDEPEPEVIEGDGYKITIDKVEDKHIRGEDFNTIFAEVFRDGESLGRAEFILKKK